MIRRSSRLFMSAIQIVLQVPVPRLKCGDGSGGGGGGDGSVDGSGYM